MVGITLLARQAELSNTSNTIWIWILVASFVLALVVWGWLDSRKDPVDPLIKQWRDAYEAYKSRKESNTRPEMQLVPDPVPVRPPGEPEWQQTIDPAVGKSGAGIFISYRRQDEPNFSGRLYDRLVIQFGEDNVFIDVGSIELGLDFAEVINRSLSQCKVVIVVIGKNWLNIADNQGRIKLKNPNDYVRLEIETALNRNIRVIPVLVEGASAPKIEDLPPSLASLARRNGIEMSHVRFASEVNNLIDTLKYILKAP
jgi:hypothetical protein